MTNISKLDKKLSELKELDLQITKLDEQKEQLRTELFEVLQKENLQQYKNDLATVSVKETKKVIVKDENRLIEDLKAQKIVKYYEEKTVLRPEFQKDVKEGLFNHPEIEITTTESITIRFS